MVIEQVEQRAPPFDRLAVFAHRLVNLRQIEPNLGGLRMLVPQHVAHDHQRLLAGLCGGGESVSGLQDAALAEGLSERVPGTFLMPLVVYGALLFSLRSPAGRAEWEEAREPVSAAEG